MNNLIDFEKIKEIVIPYFVEVWGEEFRDIIVSRINKVIPLFISTPEGMRSEMYFEQSIKRIELTLRFLEEQGFAIPENLKEQAVKQHSMYYIVEENEDIKRFLKGCFGANEFKETVYGGIDDILNQKTEAYQCKYMVETLACFDIKVDKDDYPRWRLSEEAKPVLRRLASLQASIAELKKEYGEFNAKFKDVEEMSKKVSALNSKLGDKYFFEFLHSIEEYMTEEEKKSLEDYNPDEIMGLYTLSKKCPIMQLVGSAFAYNNVFKAFTTEAEEQLANPKVSQYAKDGIINDRISYFKIKGIYDGSEPETFLTSEVALVNWPSVTMADEITKRREEYKEKTDDDILEQFSSYKENMRTIDEAELEDKPILRIKDIKKRQLALFHHVKR